MASACSIRVRGVVQGVGFRPFVYRLARANTLGGWVLNGKEGVEIYLEGAAQGLQAFVREMELQPPPAAELQLIAANPSPCRGPPMRSHVVVVPDTFRQSAATVICSLPEVVVLSV